MSIPRNPQATDDATAIYDMIYELAVWPKRVVTT